MNTTINKNDFEKFIQNLLFKDKMMLNYSDYYSEVLELYYTTYHEIPIEIIRQEDLIRLATLLKTSLTPKIKLMITPTNKKDSFNEALTQLASKLLSNDKLSATLVNLIISEIKNLDPKKYKQVAPLVIECIEKSKEYNTIEILSIKRSKDDLNTLITLLHRKIIKNPDPFCRVIKRKYKNKLTTVLMKSYYKTICSQSRKNKDKSPQKGTKKYKTPRTTPYRRKKNK